MHRTIILGLLMAATLAATPPTGGAPGQPLPPSEPGPPPATGTTINNAPSYTTNTNDAMLARAKTAFDQLRAGSLDRSTLDAQMNAALTDDKVSEVKAAIGALGAPSSFVEIKSGSQGGFPYAVYALTFGNGAKLNFIFSLDAQGKIAGMQLTPPQ